MATLLTACSATKHVPEGSYLLDKVSIEVDGDNDIDKKELYNFLRQTPNHKVLGFAKLQLATYSLSGRDSTKWYNRWLRRVGQPPVIHDRAQTDASVQQLRLALINRGYNDAEVSVDSTVHTGKKKIELDYRIVPGEPFRVASVGYDIPDTTLRRLVTDPRRPTILKPGILLDRNKLDDERAAITRRLRNAGYYDFNREFISYTADTVAGSKSVGLTLNLHAPDMRGNTVTAKFADSLTLDPHMHHRYDIRRVFFIIDTDIDARQTDGTKRDTVMYRGNTYIFGTDRYLRPKALDEMCYIEPGRPYSARQVERTYEALGRLSIIKFINIEMRPVASVGDIGLLDAYIFLARNKKQTASIEVEGTNSEGDLGFGIGLTYQHRNLAKGSELLTAKFRTSYESLSGNLQGLINKRYTEFAGEVGITFPKFECPFLSKSFKQNRLASTEFAVSANYQERPEYTRVIFGTAWKWKWQQQRAGYQRRQTFDLIDTN